MTADPAVLERIFDRLIRTLSAGGPDQLRAPFKVSEIVQALVPYRTYRNEIGVDTLQDYEHALLEMLAGERGWLICDPDTVTVIRKELASPDPDTGLLRRLQTAEVRVGAVRMPVSSHVVRPPIATPDDDAPVPPRVVSAAAVDAVRTEPETLKAASDATLGGKSDAKREAELDAKHEPAATSSPTPDVNEPPVKVSDAIAIGAVMDREDEALAKSALVHLPSVYGDPIEFRGVRHAPVDVGGVIFLFGMVARELGFNVEAMSSGFPRCEAKRQLSPGKWVRLRIEFELESRQFRDAGRNSAACDLIVCWRDTWPDRPSSLDVLSLERVLPTLSPRD